MFNEYYETKLLKKNHPELRVINRQNIDIMNCKKIHIIGVCGTAMGTCALMLRDSGFDVTGSDVSFWPPMGPLLKLKGVKIFEGWDASYIEDDVDLIVVGNACAPDHIEVIEAIRKNKPLISMPEIMGQYYVGSDKESFAVCGTHGKTTTTGLLAYVLSEIEEDPTYLIGGVMQNYISKVDKEKTIEGTSHHVGKGKYAVFEGDEYDTSFFDARPKFLHYRPAYSIITSVEWDHIDIYPDVPTYTKAFEHLIQITEKGLVISDEYPLLNKLILNTQHKAKVLVYGMTNTADLYPVLKKIDTEGQHFELFIKGESYGDYVVPMYGEYNMLNAVSVLGVMHLANIDIKSEKVCEAISSFPGMKRRQEIVFKNNDFVIIDDFAHHPTAVAETVKGIKERFLKRRIVAVFEPRSSTSRRKIFEHTYPIALAEADIIGIKIPPFKAEVDSGQDLLDPQVVKEETEKLGKTVILASTALELSDLIIPILKSGDVIVVMSNGSFDGIHKLIEDGVLGR